ncbi:MAG: flavin reductase family protein [Syntrophomonadaceae bacterium]|nr:flavin reductase family protein [Syntrophomonadaceae bacterium]
MSQKIKLDEYAGKLLAQLPKGAFLSVRSGNNINTMTIGWGAIGYIWAKPIIIVAVRGSRYTYELIEKATDFSVSVPLDDQLKHSLAGAGAQSGRNLDKFAAFRLTAAQGKTIASPVIKECQLIFECRIIFKHPVDPSALNKELNDKFYANQDYHVLYYGEILAQYTND